MSGTPAWDIGGRYSESLNDNDTFAETKTRQTRITSGAECIRSLPSLNKNLSTKIIFNVILFIYHRLSYAMVQKKNPSGKKQYETADFRGILFVRGKLVKYAVNR